MAKSSLKAGDVIDGFVIGDLLHNGGMARLWSVTRPDIDFPLLMKVPRIGEGDDPAAIEEALALATRAVMLDPQSDSAWDTLAELIPGRPDYRIVLAAGLLVPRIAVAGQLAPDGAIELIRLRLDLDAGWE